MWSLEGAIPKKAFGLRRRLVRMRVRKRTFESCTLPDARRLPAVASGVGQAQYIERNRGDHERDSQHEPGQER